MLGTDGSQGAELGLSNDWAYQIIKQVGNYGEIFERNIGVNTHLEFTWAECSVDQRRTYVFTSIPLKTVHQFSFCRESTASRLYHLDSLLLRWSAEKTAVSQNTPPSQTFFLLRLWRNKESRAVIIQIVTMMVLFSLIGLIGRNIVINFLRLEKISVSVS